MATPRGTPRDKPYNTTLTRAARWGAALCGRLPGGCGDPADTGDDGKDVTLRFLIRRNELHVFRAAEPQQATPLND